MLSGFRIVLLAGVLTSAAAAPAWPQVQISGFPWLHQSRGFYGSTGYYSALSDFYAEPRCAPGAAARNTSDYWLIARTDGVIRAVTDYRMQDKDTLIIVLKDGTQQSVPLSEIELDFTRQLNIERGVEFRLPDPAASAVNRAEAARGEDRPIPLSLREIRTVCVEQMGWNLDDYIMAEIKKELPARLSVALTGETADAVLIGDPSLRPIWPATVSVIDPQGRAVLWGLPVKRPGIWSGRGHARDQAERVVRHLKRAILTAETRP